MTEALRIQPDTIRDLLQKETGLPFGLRIVTEQDIEPLVPLINSAYQYENDEGSFKDPAALRSTPETIKLAMEEGVVVVATNPQSREIIGVFQYKDIPQQEGSEELVGYFGMLAVNPDLQGKGIGGRIVGIAENIARSRGRNTMQIQVVNHSTHLLDWYSRLGYQEFDRTDWQAPFLRKKTQFVLMNKPLFIPMS